MMKMMIMFTLCFLTFGFLWCQFFFMKFRLCFSPPAPIFAPAASFTTKHSLTPTLPFSPFVIIMIMTMINDNNNVRVKMVETFWSADTPSRTRLRRKKKIVHTFPPPLRQPALCSASPDSLYCAGQPVLLPQQVHQRCVPSLMVVKMMYEVFSCR